MTPDYDLSPGAMKKVVHAAVSGNSFRQAEEDLLALAELQVSAPRIRRAARQIGRERIADRKEEIERWEQLPLPVQRTSPSGEAPAVACVQPDGGRMQIRDRLQPESAAAASTGKTRKGRFWRETKVGCLLSMSSDEHDEDPCPRIPKTFIDPSRIDEIAREIKGFWGQAATDSEGEDEESLRVETESQRPERPQPLVKSVVATRQDTAAFGRQLASAAYQRGFAAAKRKAFVADGQACNWTIWERHFSHYTPILDFVHAICYVFSAAMASGDTAENWKRYCRWAQWLWEGNTPRIIVELQEQQVTVGLPQENEAEGSPRQRIAETLGYLRNQKSRTNYAEYRRRGLPITSCYIESTIKQINRRVKGSEKFWSTAAEEILQLSADQISETGQIDAFWRRRPSKLTGTRSYEIAS
jgi:hypothetical protein